jgi:fatty acid desaturase
VRLTYPNAEIFPWNPLVWVYMNLYFLRNTLAAFISSPRLLRIVPSPPAYRPGDTTHVALDLLAIGVVQSLLWLAGDFSLGRFLLMVLCSQFVASVFVMSYIFTNHFLKPVEMKADALRGSTSVIVPSWVDHLHAHYSYHTEHHLFPTLNSDYYPQLSRLLQQRYPDRYDRIPIAEAWRQLWRQPGFVRDPR